MANLGGVQFDSSQLESGMTEMYGELLAAVVEAEDIAAGELLRLSTQQVPLDKGDLQDSASVGRDDDGAFVAYNKVYAAYQHEGRRFDGSHVVTKWQHGRSSKYLQEPMEKNAQILGGFMSERVAEMMQ